MLITAVLIAILIYFLSNQWRRTTQLPPGPYPILLIGNLPHLLYYGYKYGGIVPALKYFKKKYGPVFTLWIGPMPSVHISDYKLSHEAMVHYGSNYQDRWSGQIDALPPPSAVVVTDFYDRLVGGIINRILFSVRINEADETLFLKMKKRLDEAVNSISIMDVFAKKWMLDIPLIKRRWKPLLDPTYAIKDFLRKQVDERFEILASFTSFEDFFCVELGSEESRRTYGAIITEDFSRKRAIGNGTHLLDSEPRDYADAFILKMNEEAKNEVLDTTFNEETLVVNLQDLWSAGQETTTTTLSWAMVYLLKYPEIVRRLREELVRVTGGSRPLTLKDKNETPYLIATIAEIQRHASILNINNWRISNADAEIGGYTVPKHTIVSAELSLILSDESIFHHAKEIIGNLILRYSIHADGPVPDEAMDRFGIMHKPQPFKMRFLKLT
ncbi:unspecific monooxygenase [Teladorsagia circumcincta]|uniref:Unspecific monooxygenase n=1 Tax=Teladorsagia circumcincta TaxID=45464 RepID=A0A2G9U7H7_TELCI|nr:unspecific monooxygenase [Teladorsagia circumcincta]